MRRLGTVLALSAALAACGGGVSINQDYAPGTDFAPYRTWNWMPNQGSTANAANNQIVDQRVRFAIEQEMTAKGYQRATSNPDFYVGYQVLLDQETSYQTVNDYWGSGWNYGWYGAPMTSTSRTYEQSWTVGTLLVDFFDADERRLVWRGTAEGTVDPDRSPEERQERINDAVSQLLGQFPPGM
jgi:hypothetical protein